MVFEGPEDYHARIDDPALAIGERSILVMRGVGPLGYPGSAEVVNMRPPNYLIEAGVPLDALHRRRQAVGHLGLAFDPERIARSCGRRRPCDPAHRRSRARGSQTAAK